MVEIELKFQIPEAYREAVHQALLKKHAQMVRLQAKYYDTADRKMAAAEMAVRLRKEGEHWVQTFKAAGSNHLQRFEHEVVLTEAENIDKPELDISRHTHVSDEARCMLEKALGESIDQLQLQFETDVERLYTVVRYQGADIEICLDRGEVRAGNTSVPIYEVEFELKQGPIKSLLALSSSWVKRYKLWLDVRSKAERGDLLAHGLAVSPAVQARAPVLSKKDSPEIALRKMITACLAQILPNAAAVADGVGKPEHLHQTRVGIRRLRSALRTFADWSDGVAPGWEPTLAELFNQLGCARDRDALAESLFPQLEAAGAPLVTLPVLQEVDAPGQALRSPEYVRLLLTLLAFANQPAEENQKNPDLMQQVEKSIRRLHRQVMKDAEGYRNFNDEQRHRIRKRLKRLRYCVDFVASLYPKKAVRKYQVCLGPAQDALGEFNDLVIAEQLFRQVAEQDPRAWFAVGWIKAHRDDLLKASVQAIDRLAQAEKFW